MKKVFTVACRIPGGFGDHISFDSKFSLLDANFVLFCPTFSRTEIGLLPLTEHNSEEIRQAIAHWRGELAAFLDAGNTVFLVLSAPEEIELRWSGELMGLETNERATNYDIFHPFINNDLGVAEGDSMVLTPDSLLLRDYWHQFGGESRYRVYLKNLRGLTPLVTTRQGNRVVGAMHRSASGGTLVALPWLRFWRDEFFVEEDEDEEEDEWTHYAKDWGKRYLSTLKSLDRAIRSENDATPAPDWAQQDSFKTDKEIEFSKKLVAIRTELTNLEQQRQQFELDVANAGSLKSLLFEQGHALEMVVLEAMTLLGFNASNYRDSDSEFDVVLECPEGRCIGEVEGRDRKAIDINKMRQLETNIHEDLDREEVSEPAKAVLFGNAYRFVPPSDRPEHFTQKCIKAAQRTNTALIRTCDLFEVAKALVDKPDPAFTAACRKAILKTSGEEVKFPTLPEPDENNHGNNPS